ncbi:MAG: hypothetical protein ABIH23_23375, partial [bacterium]
DADLGEITVGEIPSGESGFSDGQGVKITTARGQVELLLFPSLEVGESMILMRASVRSTGPGASVGLAALDGSMDGSIATNIPANSRIFQDGYHLMALVYNPPGTSVIPVFQVANLTGFGNVTVYLDNLEVYVLPEDGCVSNEMLWSAEYDSDAGTCAPDLVQMSEINSIEEFAEYPGGFIDADPGQLVVGEIPLGEGGFSDGQGAKITVARGQVELLLFPSLEVGEDTIFMRASVRSTGAGASVGFAALDGSMDGSIATNIPANSRIFQDEYDRMVLIYDPPETTVIPVFQVANLAGFGNVTVYLDNLEIYVLPEGGCVSNSVLYGD